MLTVKLRLAAVFDAQPGGFATGWSPVSWGSIDELFVNLTIPARQFLVLTFAGWVTRHQDDLIAYLREENRVLREHLGPRPLRLTDAPRRRLAVRGQKLGRRVWMQVAGIVTPDPILRWYRRVIAQTYDGSARRVEAGR